jgi:opacity protein-like surface antigen
MKKLIFAAVLTGMTAMTAAQAQSNPYIGVGVAAADHDLKIGAAGSTTSDGWKASGKIFGGVDINQTFGVEAGYTDVRKADHTYTIGGVTNRATSEGNRSYIAAKGTLPVNDAFSVYGKLGAGYSKVKLSSATLGNTSDSKTEVYAGLGAQYKISEKVALTAEYERYGKSKDAGVKADAISLGARYSF